MSIIKITSIILAGLLLVSAYARADVAVIVHPDNPLTSISVDDLRNLYLGKVRTYPNGHQAEIIDLGDGTPLCTQFYAAVLNKTSAQLNAYRAQRLFSGKGLPPNTVATDSEAVAWVARNPQGLAYVDKSKVNGDVKILMTIQ
ncbi:MAG: hypothetical protein FD165_2350 [Gammaproteobacteria bacterium]|nr:MAG: hypothetical protein FD165_2350 [Gammaproteobacteria bacterium]TND01430.1 MAG: hypothetical protein FD120_2603 [Gammaproteobacteria bacterium]